MVETGASAPLFEATIGTSDHEPFALQDVLGDGPVVLAFFPGAFTPPCRSELLGLQERLGEFEAAGATVLGVSVDNPFAQGAFRDANDVEFTLVSDMAREAVEAYDVGTDVPELGLHHIANRAVFVVDDEGTVTYTWRADDPTAEPPYDDLIDAVTALE